MPETWHTSFLEKEDLYFFFQFLSDELNVFWQQLAAKT